MFHPFSYSFLYFLNQKVLENKVNGGKERDDEASVGETTASTTTVRALGEEKPQIDLNEFLQQLGILKEEEKVGESEGEEAIGGCSLGSESCDLKDNYSEELEVLSDKTFNWDSFMEMQDIIGHDHNHNGGTDHQIRNFQVYDYVNYYEDDLSFPTSIWDFQEEYSTRFS